MVQPTNKRLVTEASVGGHVATQVTTPGTATATALSATYATPASVTAQTATKLDKTEAAMGSRGSYVRVAFCGDSLTDGAGSTNTSIDSFRAYLSKILGTSLVPTSGTYAAINGGVPGNSAAQLLARMDAIIALNPGAYVVMIGENASTSLAQYKSDLTAIIAKIRATGRPMILCAITPRAAASAAENERINGYNLALSAIAAREDIPVVPTSTALTDTATGALAVAYVGTDDTHFNPAGHLLVAQTIAPYLADILPPVRVPTARVGAPGLAANPLQTGGSGSTQPTGWASASAAQGVRTLSAEAAVANDGLVQGQWFKMQTDATANGSTQTNTMYYPLTGTHAEGDILLVRARVKTTTLGTGGMKISAANGGTDFSVLGESFGVTTPGTILRTVTLPASPTAPRIRLTVSAPAGTIRDGFIGELQVWNLTQLGLTDLY